MALRRHTITRENDMLPDPQGNLIVTIQVSFLLRRLRRRGEGERRGIEDSGASLRPTPPNGPLGPFLTPSPSILPYFPFGREFFVFAPSCGKPAWSCTGPPM